MKLINNHTWGRQKRTSVFAHFLLEKKKPRHHEISLPNLHFSFIHYISLCFFFNFKIFSMFYFGWLLIFSLFFMTADCISFVWVHLAFFFLSVQVKKKNQKHTKKKSLHELERPARTFYNDLFSLLMSRLKKQKGPVVLADCVAAGGRRKTSLSCLESTLNLVWAQPRKTQTQFKPFFHRDPSCWVFLLPPGGGFGLHSIWTFILCLPDSFSPHQHLF